MSSARGLCFGLVLLCLVYCIGNISGCHVNPAVSFAMLLSGRMKFGEFCGYVAAQLVGAAIAALCWIVLTGNRNRHAIEDESSYIRRLTFPLHLPKSNK